MSARFLFPVLLVAFLAVPSALAQPSRDGGVRPLFDSTPALKRAPERELGTLRAQPVGVDFDALRASMEAWTEDPSSASAALELNLFPDLSHVAVLDRVAFEWETNVVWIGHLEGVDDSLVVLVVGDGVAVGTIRWKDRAFRLRYLPQGAHVVEEVDLTAFPAELEPIPIFPEIEEGDTPGGRLSRKLVDNGTTIDLMVAYTQAARSAAGGTTAMQNLITLGVAETNIAFANSQMVSRLRLVHMVEVSYTESSSLTTDLSRVQAPSDGYMDNVHTLRNTYGADLVKLVVANTAGNACGVAYLMAGWHNRAFESSAFSVTARPCITPNYTFGHELGHNLGANHAPGDGGLGTGAFNYSFGYKNPQALFRTIMAYDCSPSCPRLLYFSTPAVTYQGSVVGTTNQNNAASGTNVRSVVTNFRPSSAPPSCSGTPGQWSGCRGQGCTVCVEKVASYPLYFHNHPLCNPNNNCGGQYFTCNANCPAPTSADLCNGTSGGWVGCRGDGCSVCMEKLANYPLYFHNNPACKRNDTCAGQFYTCNVNCPAPDAADQCNGTPGQWSGCRGTGCSVCAELVASYPCYFKNHPLCQRNTICGGQYFTCNANCPAPTAADAC